MWKVAFHQVTICCTEISQILYINPVSFLRGELIGDWSHHIGCISDHSSACQNSVAMQWSICPNEVTVLSLHDMCTCSGRQEMSSQFCMLQLHCIMIQALLKGSLTANKLSESVVCLTDVQNLRIIVYFPLLIQSKASADGMLQ